MDKLVRYATSLWTLIGSAVVAVVTYTFDALALFTTPGGEGPPWQWVTLFALVVFVAVLIYRDVFRESLVLDTRNQNECLKVLDAALWTVRDARGRVAGSSIPAQQHKVQLDTWMALRGSVEKIDDLGRPGVAYKVALEFYIDSRRAVPNGDIYADWFDRLESALNTARKDVWKGRR